MSWLRRWLRDEDFWKQITVNVVSAGVVAVLAYIFAVSAGYLQRPEVVELIPFGLALLVIVGIGGFSNILIARKRDRLLKQGHPTEKLELLSSSITAILSMALGMTLTIGLGSLWS